MLNEIITIISLITSIASLLISVISIRIISPSLTISKLSICIPDNPYMALFITDGYPNNENHINIINWNNRDILIYIKTGYIHTKQTTHVINSKYYTLQANSVTPIKITTKPKNIKPKSYRDETYDIKIKYNNLPIYKHLKGPVINTHVPENMQKSRPAHPPFTQRVNSFLSCEKYPEHP